jgi:hypothetical protein
MQAGFNLANWAERAEEPLLDTQIMCLPSDFSAVAVSLTQRFSV